jgi:hypothetical protein
VLFNSCRRTRVLFDVRCHRDRLNILQATEARALAPIQELADGMIVSDPRVLVADGNGKKFEVSLGRFRADIGDERWNLEARIGWLQRGDSFIPKDQGLLNLHLENAAFGPPPSCCVVAANGANNS